MKSGDNIEQLFKDTFEHFESPVNPQVWTQVQNGIKITTGVTAPSVAKVAVGKIIASAFVGLTIDGSVWYFSSDDLTPPIANKENQTNAFPENSLKNSENKIPATSSTVPSPSKIGEETSPAPTLSQNTKSKNQQSKIIS